MNKAILDTDILSEILKGRNQSVRSRVTTYLIHFQHLTISVVSVIEVVKGWRKLQREDAIQRFMNQMSAVEVLSVDTAIAELAGRISADLEKAGQGIGLADTIIAATSIHCALTLVTGNSSHYQRIQGLGYDLQLDNWRISGQSQ